MKIKMIASDMDDTLLNNERKISPRNLAAIKRALAAGIVFTLATGRMYRSIKPFAEQLQLVLGVTELTVKKEIKE